MYTTPRFARLSRLAAWLLLMIWVGPVTIVQTDTFQVLKMLGAPERAMAEPRVIPAGRAIQLQIGTSMELRLRDGGVRWGRFLGRALLDSAVYASRFESHARSSSYVPLALGETLHVSLRDGRAMTAPFAGYAELTLLLRSPDGSERLRVPFESAKEIRRSNGDLVPVRDLTRAFRADSLPSAEALALGERLPATHEPKWAGALLVAVQDIATAVVELPSSPASSGVSPGAVVGIVLLSVLIAVVIVFWVIGSAIDSSRSGCSSSSGSVPRWLSRGPRTTRPFDRDRGCFVGDPLAVADPWPGASQSPATAMADRATSDALAR